MKANKLSPTVKTIERIPVFIISGFLGSGKTTLLNQLLRQWPKSAVIINEFGTTPIDQQLLREHQVPLSTLVGGCLCCQVSGALAPLLKNLRMAWDSKNKPFDRVIIETSGVVNPEPVMDILFRDRWLSARYSLQSAITTVSAIMAERHFDFFPEAQAQVAWADTVILTQTDLAEPEQIKQMHSRLDQLAPAATRLTAIQGAIDPDSLLNLPKKFRQWRDPELQKLPEHSFSSITLQLESPIPWERLQAVLSHITTHYSEQLVRLKGLVYTTENNQPLLIQGSAGKLYPPTYLPSRLSDDGVGRLVFISYGEIKGLMEVLLSRLRTP